MCGPAAIAAITGKPVSEVKERVYSVKGKRYICGMSPALVRKTLATFGYSSELSFTPDKPTFAAWLASRDNPEELCLVELTGHFVVVQGQMVVDNHTKRPVAVKDAPWRRKRVKAVCRISLNNIREGRFDG